MHLPGVNYGKVLPLFDLPLHKIIQPMKLNMFG